ncbi:hypothetical protein ACLKA7_011345 [Drosophila subpalustris]
MPEIISGEQNLRHATISTPHLQSISVVIGHMIENRRADVEAKLGRCACVDVNHAPCQKSGHKAHWALVVGYLIDDQDEFHVLARHGKTRNLAVWSLSGLSQSNANLVEFAQPKGYPDCTFLLPPGGLDGPLGLRERAILVEGLTQQIVKIC